MLLIIGLDGATWDLLDPWIAEGRLPNLARLRAQGLWGGLASTMPPATFPSWATFMTGVNPGKHGIFDFTRREFGTYEVRFVNATFRKVPSIWKLLSDAGKRVCVLGLPGTYPPERLNGCMISGFDSPVTTRADASFVEPETLAPLVEEIGGFPFADFQEFRVGPGWYEKALQRLLRGVEVKTRLAQVLLHREPWDCFLLLFGESDTVAHHFWRFYDPRSPRYDARGAARLGDAVAQVYEALDAAIGVLTREAEGATVLVASDHGFGGAGNKVVHLNNWLCEQGFQAVRAGRAGLGVAGYAKRWALQLVPAALQARAFRLNGGRWANRLESRARFAGIDWARTRAFSEELGYFPSVWINLKGREPAGTVDPSDYERVCNDVCAAAGALRDPEHGQPLVRRAWRREQLYTGPWVRYAPDIVLEFNLDGDYSYTCLPSPSRRTGGSIRRLDAQAFAGGKLAGMSGSHRENGVFLLAGAGVRGRGRRFGVAIADMAPTILKICEVPASREFDGRTIDLIVDPSDGSSLPAARLYETERVYARAEEDELARRLSALGYWQ